MPWFYCDDCGDSIKKPKLQAHTGRCTASSFTCIDCGTTFDQSSAKGHTRCVTEKQKYVEGATKPGGFAAQGFVASAKIDPEDGQFLGEAYLSTRAPWNCRLCGTRCTSRETLLSHARGIKHKKKVRNAEAKGKEEAAAEKECSPETGVQGQRQKVAEKRAKLFLKLATELLQHRKKGMGMKKFKRRLTDKCKGPSCTEQQVNDFLISMRQMTQFDLKDKRIFLKTAPV